MTILDEIIAYKRTEVAAAKNSAPREALEVLAKQAGPVRPFKAALEKRAQTGIALIAEIKKASPSKGLIRENFMPEDHARDYEAGGATCLSVLTDEPSFQGNSKYLRVARAACSLPVLRKDFMIDPYQCIEARAWGADCILIILACVDDALAKDLIDTARDFGMDSLVEVHDSAEMERAVDLDAPMIGINNRNLKTFQTRLDTTAMLSRLCSPNTFLIAESGITDHADIVRLQNDGAKAFLIGESLMRQPDITAATRQILGLNTAIC